MKIQKIVSISIFDVELTCNWCGKKYTGGGTTGGFLGTKNYCSRKCKSEDGG